MLAGDEAGVDPAVECRRCSAQYAGGLTNAEQFSNGPLTQWFETGYLPVTAQVTDEVLVETQSLCAQTALRIENACDGRVGIVLREPTYQCKSIFVGANGGRAGARQRDIAFGEVATAPAQFQMSLILFAIHGNRNLLEQRAQQLLSVAHGETRRLP